MRGEVWGRGGREGRRGLRAKRKEAAQETTLVLTGPRESWGMAAAAATEIYTGYLTNRLPRD
jgi:hypothetical protein